MTYGDPRNPPLLFLHGIRLGGRIWEPHAQMLRDEFFVVTPDLPGHGALADLPFDIPVNDAFLAYIAERVLPRPPLIIGYSLGGYVAMRYAVDLPDESAGLLLTGCTTDLVHERALLYELGVACAAQLPAAAIDRILKVFFRMTLPPDVARIVVPFRFDHRTFELSRRTALGTRYSEALRAYRKPVAIVNGEWDALFRIDESRFARATNARVQILRNSDHVAPLRRPAAFTASVRAFARRVFDPSASGPMSYAGPR